MIIRKDISLYGSVTEFISRSYSVYTPLPVATVCIQGKFAASHTEQITLYSQHHKMAL